MQKTLDINNLFDFDRLVSLLVTISPNNYIKNLSISNVSDTRVCIEFTSDVYINKVWLTTMLFCGCLRDKYNLPSVSVISAVSCGHNSITSNLWLDEDRLHVCVKVMEHPVDDKGYLYMYFINCYNEDEVDFQLTY